MQNYENQNLQKGKIMLVFSADWCPDCVVIKPFMPDIIAKYPEITFYLVDNDTNPDLCDQYDIFGIPSFIYLKDGNVVAKYVDRNHKTKEQIINFIEENRG